MLTLALLFLFPVQLAGADIAIELSADTAIVDSRFALRSSFDPQRFSLTRIPDQRIEPLELEDAPAGLPTWETRRGLIWITFPTPAPTGDDRGVVRLRYRVSGRLERIPLPVPQIAAQPGQGAVTVRVRGIDTSARLLDGFPRLAWQADGWAVARLDNVPGFVRRPPTGSAWSVSRGAQWFVVLLVVGGSAAWALRARRPRRAPARRAAGPD